MPQWNWNDPTIQLAPKRAMENIEPIAGGLADRPHASDCAVNNGPAYPPGPCNCGAVFALPSLPTPRPEAIAKFLRVVRSMNNDEEPDREGPNAEVWRWLVGLTNPRD